MSKKVIILITLLILVLGIYIQALTQKSNQIPALLVPFSPTPIVQAESSLSFTPDAIYARTGQNNEAGIQINSQGKYPTSVQIELAYDPEILTQVTLSPGTLFPNANILLNNNDEALGRISYALSIGTNEKSIDYSGTVATIKFKVKENIVQNQTSIYFLPKTTIISQNGNIPLKIAYGLKIFINQSPPVASTSPAIR